MKTAKEGQQESEDRFRIDPEEVAAVVEALERADRDEALRLTEGFHNADFADLIEQIKPDDRRRLVEVLGSDLDPQILIELEEGARDEVLGLLEPEDLVRAASELESDDAVYLLEDLDADQRQRVMEALDHKDRVPIQKSLDWPDDSAGRMMQSDVVKAPQYWTVGQIIDDMRAKEELPAQFHQIVVIDPMLRPMGVVPLGLLMGTPRHVALDSIMLPEFHTVKATDSQKDVAYAFHQYHLVSVPVVDGAGRLVGAIDIEDAVDALDERTREDIHHLGRLSEEEEITDTVPRIVWRRSPWLAVNLLTAVIASAVIAQFEDAIERIVALAVLMPIVASMGGIAGTQSLTVAVRAMATRDLTRTNAGRVIVREAVVGLANGLAFAAIIGAAAYVAYGDRILGALLAASMVVNMAVAGLAGVLVPLACKRANIDPALASGTFVSTVTDVVGFGVFLGLAAAVLA